MTKHLFALALAVGLASAWPFPESAPSAQQAAPPAQQPATVPAAAARGGPPVQGAEPDIPLVAQFDRNKDKQLDYAERTAAREYLAAHPELRRPARGGRINRTGAPGAKLTPADVKS